MISNRKFDTLRIVMVFGTFDIFHKGHRNFLKQARRYGNYLLVVIALDKTVLRVKKRKTVNTEKKRLDTVAKSRLANEVVLGNNKNKYAIIKKYQPAIICLGYDQKFFVDKLEDELKKMKLEKTKIIKLKSFHPEKYKSSKMKKEVRNL